MRIPAVLTVLGEDRVGIIAAVSSTLAESGVNIVDVRQTILGDIFSMTMLLTIDEDRSTFSDVQSKLGGVAESMGLQITLQREDVFKFMYRV